MQIANEEWSPGAFSSYVHPPSSRRRESRRGRRRTASRTRTEPSARVVVAAADAPRPSFPQSKPSGTRRRTCRLACRPTRRTRSRTWASVRRRVPPRDRPARGSTFRSSSAKRRVRKRSPPSSLRPSVPLLSRLRARRAARVAERFPPLQRHPLRRARAGYVGNALQHKPPAVIAY